MQHNAITLFIVGRVGPHGRKVLNYSSLQSELEADETA